MSNKPDLLLVSDEPQQAEFLGGILRTISPEIQVNVLTTQGTQNSVSSLSSEDKVNEDWIASLRRSLVILHHRHAMRFLESLRRQRPGVSVIVIAQTASVEDAVASLKLGAEDYLSSPVNPDALQLAVKRGLSRQAIYPESSAASRFVELISVCQMVSSSLNRDKAIQLTLNYFQRELEAPYACVYLVPKSLAGPSPVEKLPEKMKVAEIGEARSFGEIVDFSLGSMAPLDRIVGSPANAEASGVISDSLFRFVDRGQLTPGFFFFRFRCGGDEDLYLVCLSPLMPKDLGEFEARVRILAAQLEVTGRTLNEYQGVKSLVFHDEVTGLYNTRYLHSVVDREINLAKQTGRSFGVLFIDLDHFKKVNDNHGHLIGTGVLRELGQDLRRETRESDFLFRYGGDEFIVVLSAANSSVDLPTAQKVAERIRSAVEQKVFGGTAGLRLTVSIGIALYPQHATSKEAILQAADAAMYSAKKKTRNCVFVAPTTTG